MANTTRNLDIVIRVQDQATASIARLEQQLRAFGQSVQRTQAAAVATVGPGMRQAPGGVGAGAAPAQAARQAAQDQAQAARQAAQEQLQAARLAAQGQMQQARLAAQVQAQEARQAAQAQAQAARLASQQQMQAARLAAQAQMQAARLAAQEAARQARATRQGASAVSEMRQAILGMAATVVSIRALTSALQGAVATAMQFERMAAVFNLVNQGSGGAAAAFAFVRAEADRLGADLLTLAQGYMRLTAATQGTTFAGKGTEEMLQGLNAAFRAYRLTSQEARDATRPLIQMFQSGTVQLDELRNELGTRVPTALKDMSLAFNGAVKDETEMFEAMEKGRVTVDAARNAVYNLTQIWRERYTPAALAAAQATDAAFNRLNNSWLELQKTLGDQLLPGLGEVARALQELVDQANASAKGMDEGITETIRLLGAGIIGVAGTFVTFGKVIATVSAAAADSIEFGLAASVQTLKIGLDDAQKSGETFAATMSKLMSGAYAAPPPAPGAAPKAQLREVVLGPGKKEADTPAEKAEKQRVRELAQEWEQLQTRMDKAFYTETQAAERRLKALGESKQNIEDYLEALQATIDLEEANVNLEERTALTRQLAAENQAILHALEQRLPLEQAEAEMAAQRLARTDEQLLGFLKQLDTRRALTREYAKQQVIITHMQTIDDDLTDGAARLAYARAHVLTTSEAELELAVRRLAMSTEEQDALLAKLRLLREQNEQYDRQNEQVQENRDLIRHTLKFLDVRQTPILPRPRSTREEQQQMLDELRRRGASADEMALAERLAAGRLEAVALNDVMETMRDTAGSLADTLEKGLVDVLLNASEAGKTLGETMQDFGKGLVKLFGEEIIKLGLIPLRNALDEFMKELAKSETIKTLVKFGLSLLGSAAGGAAGGTVGAGPGGIGTLPFGAHGGIFGVQGMARGGLVASPSLRLLGEATPEAVVPLTAEGIAKFTRGVTQSASRGAGQASPSSREHEQRRWQETVDALAKRPVVIEVTLNNPIDPRKMGLQPEEVVQVVGRNINEDGIIRRLVVKHAQR